MERHRPSSLNAAAPALPPGAIFESVVVTRQRDIEPWVLQHGFGEHEPVVESRVVVEFPSKWQVKWTLTAQDSTPTIEPVVTIVGKSKRVVFSKQNIEGVLPEWHAPPVWLTQPRLALRLDRWTENGAAKQAPESPEALSRWQWSRYQEKKVVTPEMVTAAREVLANVPDEPEAKARALYEYACRRVQYCAIEVGYGGWIPHSSKDVHEKKWGDCKDKATYLQALLEVAGIESSPTTIFNHDGSPRPFVMPSLGANFNHAILAVRLPSGTVYADPTARAVPFGRLPAGDSGATVLELTKEGAALKTTPESGAEEDGERQRFQLALDTNGRATGSFTLEAWGNNAGPLRGRAIQGTGKLEPWLVDVLWLRNSFVKNARFVEAGDFAPTTSLSGEIGAREVYARGMGPAGLLRVGEFLSEHVPQLGELRTAAYAWKWVSTQETEVVFTLPPGVTVSRVPADVEVDSEFGKLHLAWQSAPGTLTVKRSMKMKKRMIPAKEIPAARNWAIAVRRAEQEPAVQPDGSVRQVETRDILSDTNAKGERETNAKFFRFPDVQVGSVLEYAYVVRVPWVVGTDSQDTLGIYPVKHYEFELTGSRLLPLETIEYNSTRPIEVTTLNDGRTRLRFSLDDLPPRPTEDWAPHWTFTEPYWSWRVLGYKVSTQVTTPWFREWTDVVEGTAREAWLNAKAYEGMNAWPDLSGCADAACKVQKSTEWIQQKTSSLNIDTNRHVELAEAFSSGQASAKERAFLLRKALEREGVEANLLFTTTAHSRLTRRSFPEYNQFNRMLVWVPAQSSIPKPIPIDLDTDFCRPGQLPEGVNNEDGFVFWMIGGVVGEGDVGGEWVRLEGPGCVPASRHDAHRAVLKEDGALVDVIEVQTRGALSEFWQIGQRDWTERQFRGEMSSRAFSTSRTAWESNWKWLKCERLEGKCDHAVTVTAPRLGVKDGASWLVPLLALTAYFSNTFTEERRSQDIHISANSGILEETFELEIPKGFHAVSLPDAVADSVPGIAIRMTAERIPRGVRVTRRLSLSPGIYDKTQYPKLRAVMERFQRYRQTVLQFDPD